jgi:glycosyltransferase involved in cell wall biosynthesis
MLKISVVTPSYNQANFLEECLLSVKQQTHPVLEHIVVDGASTDGTLEILKRYASQPGWEHLKVISEPDRGQSDALNKGFQIARGEVIGWLNSDDFYLPSCFEAISQAYQQDPSTDLLYGDFLWTDVKGVPFQVRREIAFSKFALVHNHMCYIPSSGAMFFRRRVVEDGHRLNRAYHYAMDYEFFLRLARAGYRFVHIPSLLSGLRLHAECKSSAQAAKMTLEHEKARREYLSGTHLSSTTKRARIELMFLRLLAHGRRWGEKALRGYYFTQFRPSGRNGTNAHQGQVKPAWSAKSSGS